MKKIVLFLFLIFQNNIFSQTPGYPITVNPLIGEKLDRIENKYFNKIFPSFEGFIEAEFYLHPDSSLTAKIVYEQSYILKDSIIDNVYNLNRLQKYLINKVIRDIKTYNIEDVRVVFVNGTETQSFLFSVNADEVKIFNHIKEEAFTYKNEEIKKIIKQKSVSVSTFNSISVSNVLGSLIGIPVGALIGNALLDEPKPNTLDFSPVTAPLLGGVLGMIAGYLIGSMIGETVIVNEEFTTNSEGWFSHLDEYSILSMYLRFD